MIKPLVTALLCTALLGACQNQKRVTYDGQLFRAKAKKVDKQRDSFVVRVKDPGKSLLGARQAAHHTGVTYCIRTFGSSDIVWSVDPLDRDIAPSVVDGDLVYSGTCPQAQRIVE